MARENLVRIALGSRWDNCVRPPLNIEPRIDYHCFSPQPQRWFGLVPFPFGMGSPAQRVIRMNCVTNLVLNPLLRRLWQALVTSLKRRLSDNRTPFITATVSFIIGMKTTAWLVAPKRIELERSNLLNYASSARSSACTGCCNAMCAKRLA